MAFETLWLTSTGGAVVYEAKDFRQLISSLFSTGVLSGLAVSQQSAMNVQVAAGSAVIPSASNEGKYLAWETAATTGVAIGAAPVTVGQSRNDLVCLFTKDPAASGGTAGRVTQVVVVAGTAATTGTQVDPSVPAFHLALARVTVANGTAAITNAMITDLRSIATLAGDYVDDAQATRLGTDAATASVVMRRDASGRAKVAAPSASGDIANKDYVDNTAGSPAGAANTLVRLDANQRANVGTAVDPFNITNKAYVDTAVTTAVTATAGSSGAIKWSRVGPSPGGTVTVRGTMAANAVSGAGFIPAGFRPTATEYAGGRVVGGPNDGNSGGVSVAADGTIDTTAGSPSDSVGFSITYIAA